MSEARKQWLLKVIAGPHQGAEISLDEGKALVGSDDACDVVLHDVMIAPQHLELEFSRNDIVAAPLGGRVFLNGKRIKESRQKVPDFAFISIGGSHLVIGPQESKWPLLSPADVPDLEKEVPEAAKETTEPAAETSVASTQETKAEDSEISPAKRRSAWFGVILGCIMLVGWLIAWKTMMSERNALHSAPELTIVEQAREALRISGVEKRIELEESAGRLSATGYVDTDAKQREVHAALRQVDPGIRMRVWSLEKVLSSTRTHLLNLKAPLMATSLQEGELKITGVLQSQDDWDRIRQSLLTEIPGLSGIEDQVRIEPNAQVLPVKAKSTSPTPAVAAETSEPKPVVVEVAPEPVADPVSDHEDTTVAAINASSDGLGWMKISTGSVYFKGGQLPLGGTIVDIKKDSVGVMHEGKKRDIKRGERLYNNASLQTVATPAPLAEITPP